MEGTDMTELGKAILIGALTVAITVLKDGNADDL